MRWDEEAGFIPGMRPDWANSGPSRYRTSGSQSEGCAGQATCTEEEVNADRRHLGPKALQVYSTCSSVGNRSKLVSSVVRGRED